MPYETNLNKLNFFITKNSFENKKYISEHINYLLYSFYFDDLFGIFKNPKKKKKMCNCQEFNIIDEKKLYEMTFIQIPKEENELIADEIFNNESEEIPLFLSDTVFLNKIREPVDEKGKIIQEFEYSLDEFEKAYIISSKFTRNNVIITLLDAKKNVLTWLTPSNIGFINSKKKESMEMLMEKIEYLKDKFKVEHFILKLIGTGKLRRPFLYKIIETNLPIIRIEEHSKYAFNGIRPPKRRRI